MELIAIPAVTGIVGYFIGKTKGRPGLGALIGFVIGPIGLLIVCFLKDIRNRCQYCGGVLNDGATFCPHCRRNLFDRKSVKKKQCPHCRKYVLDSVLSPGLNSCPFCGGEFDME